MSWWNSIHDLGGDLGSILKGQNPSNQAPPVARPTSGPYLGGGTSMAPASTGQTVSANSDDPSGNWDGDPLGGDVTGSDAGGGVDMSGLTNALKTGGSAIASWIAAHPKDVLSLVSAYSQYQRQGKGDAFANAGLALATNEYNDPTGKAALRTAGTAGMLNPKANTPDLSRLQSIAGTGSGNPFATAAPPAPLNHPAPLPLASSSPAAPGSPLQGIAGLNPPPLPLAGTETGTAPTIPTGMKPPTGWTPPKALPLAVDPSQPRVT